MLNHSFANQQKENETVANHGIESSLQEILSSNIIADRTVGPPENSDLWVDGEPSRGCEPSVATGSPNANIAKSPVFTAILPGMVRL